MPLHRYTMNIPAYHYYWGTAIICVHLDMLDEPPSPTRKQIAGAR